MTLEESLLPENMIELYARGAFPMADENGDLNWYCPDIRTIIPLDKFNIPRSLRKFMEKSDFQIRFDINQMRIVKECANRKETWISKDIISAYENLLNMGHLHSVEVYEKNNLIGGLYGITFRGAFFGESMFSKKSQASKCALAALLNHLNLRGYVLLDVQFITNHLEMFGACEVPFTTYENLLIIAHQVGITFI